MSARRGPQQQNFMGVLEGRLPGGGRGTPQGVEAPGGRIHTAPMNASSSAIEGSLSQVTMT